MKTPLKFFLAAFVSFALILSVISTKQARAVEGQTCLSQVPAIEQHPNFVGYCSCHGQTIPHIECVPDYGCHEWCYGSFCED